MADAVGASDLAIVHRKGRAFEHGLSEFLTRGSVIRR
jgi:hypothetical protein